MRGSDGDICCSQELESAWGKIDHAVAQDKAVLVVSREIKTELGGFRQKVDESSHLTDEDHRGYVVYVRFVSLPVT